MSPSSGQRTSDTFPDLAGFYWYILPAFDIIIDFLMDFLISLLPFYFWYFGPALLLAPLAHHPILYIHCHFIISFSIVNARKPPQSQRDVQFDHVLTPLTPHLSRSMSMSAADNSSLDPDTQDEHDKRPQKKAENHRVKWMARPAS